MAGVLIGLGLYGVDLASVFLGTPWRSSLPSGQTAMVLEGIIVSVTILFGGLLVAGIIALAVEKPPKEKSAEKKNEPQGVS